MLYSSDLKYFFLRKIWRNDLYLTATFVKFNKFFFVYSILKKIENWNLNISFFVNCKLLKGFVFININRLKNIFLKVLSNKNIWFEIKKMFFVRLIDFSKDYIYHNFDFKGFNSLSYLLFNIYLSELDFYIFSLCGSRSFIYLMCFC